MDYQTVIKAPISAELADFIEMFNRSLDHEDGMLAQALNHIRQRGGKRMRPILILLIAKSFGAVTEVTQHAAIGLELLHTASLVHDDVVDESAERRGQASVNAIYDNKVSVLVGDYILSTALLHVSYTHRERIIRYLAQLGRTLSDGEILQLSNISNRDISEDVYYNIIKVRPLRSSRRVPPLVRWRREPPTRRLRLLPASARTLASSSKYATTSSTITTAPT